MAPHAPTGFEEAGIAKQFDDIDREIARLALLCKVRILQPGIVERVLHDDATVCGADNPVAFRKMRDLVKMHFMARGRAGEDIGAGEAKAIIDLVVGRIRDQFARLGITEP